MLHMNKPQARDYTYEVRWDREEEAFLCHVRELPGLGARADAAGYAVEAAMHLVGEVLLDASRKRRPPPIPPPMGWT